MARTGHENLRPVKTHAEAVARGKLGGIKSGEVKRERKLLSQLYADILAKGFEVDGERLPLDAVISAIMDRKDSSSVSMLKEIREATEGSKIAMTINPDDPSLMTPDQRRARIAELQNEKQD